MIQFFLFLFLTFGGELHAKVEFSSSFVKKVSFSIKDGTVLTKQPDLVSVQNQLRYLFGVLNEVDSGIDFPNVEITIKKTRSVNDLFEVTYKVQGEIAWDAKHEIPNELNFILPRRGDESGLTEFLNKYQKNCSKKPASLGSFWNYYRPHHAGCPFLDGINNDVIEISVKLKEFESSDNKREPNYRAIFEDNILEITTIITKDNPVDAQDISISDFKDLCNFFVKDSISDKQLIQECHSEGFKNGQTVKSHIFLIDNFNDNPELLLQKLTYYFSTSDIVTYNGHSGMGFNIDSWINFYPISKNKYQIIFLNSCDTFGYFRNEFFEKVKRINQVSSSSEFVDMILNATPNYFGSFAKTNSSLVDLLLKNSNFDELVQPMPKEQHALVLNER